MEISILFKFPIKDMFKKPKFPFYPCFQSLDTNGQDTYLESSSSLIPWDKISYIVFLFGWMFHNFFSFDMVQSISKFPMALEKRIVLRRLHFITPMEEYSEQFREGYLEFIG